MDIGDIIRLIFFALIFLSFFGGGLLNRGRDNAEDDQRPAPRPTDISQSGGQEPRPQRTAPLPQRAPQERQMPTTASEWWEELTGQRSQQDPQPQPQPVPAQRQPEPQASANVAEAERIEAERAERLREQRARATAARDAVRSGERTMLEHDISDMPSPMDMQPRRRRNQEIGSTISRRNREIGGDNRRGRRTGGDVLRGWLTEPETLERAFIIKEVLDEPLSLRKERDVLQR